MKLFSLLATSLLLAGTVLGQNCTFTNFGRPCGGAMAGSLVRGPAIRMAVTGAMPGEAALLVVGHAMSTPLPLPGSNCLLLVQPRVVLQGSTDRAGAANFVMRLPPIVPLNVDFQCVVVDITRTGRVAESTNGVNLVCR